MVHRQVRQTRKMVKSAVEEVLDEDLPDSYYVESFKEKTDKIYELILDFSIKGDKSVA